MKALQGSHIQGGNERHAELVLVAGGNTSLGFSLIDDVCLSCNDVVEYYLRDGLALVFLSSRNLVFPCEVRAHVWGPCS